MTPTPPFTPNRFCTIDLAHRLLDATPEQIEAALNRAAPPGFKWVADTQDPDGVIGAFVPEAATSSPPPLDDDTPWLHIPAATP